MRNKGHFMIVLTEILMRVVYVSLIFIPLGIWKAFELMLLFINYLLKS